MPNISTRPTQLPEELGMYVDALRKKCPAIDQVWLLGPRANDPESRGTDWDLLLFADARVLREVRSDASWRRGDLNLMIVTDGDRFESAWGEPAGSLAAMQWRLDDPQSATYLDGAGDSENRAAAVRVR